MTEDESRHRAHNLCCIMDISFKYIPVLQAALMRAFQEGAEEERESCAKIAEMHQSIFKPESDAAHVSISVASYIRARSSKGGA